MAIRGESDRRISPTLSIAVIPTALYHLILEGEKSPEITVLLFLVNSVILIAAYLLYQVMEYKRLHNLRQANYRQERVIDDWPSRDIADLMLGTWLGIPTQTAIVILTL